jgi:hypothetical protein
VATCGDSIGRGSSHEGLAESRWPAGLGVIHLVLHRPVPVELTDDAWVGRRVKRLAATSAVALGLVWALSVTTLETPLLVDGALALGWISMPLVLIVGLRRPSARYWLILPSTLVSLGLLAISIGWLPDDPVAAAGWLTVTVGVVLGGVMGAWFWFRVLPVPTALDDPSTAGRWAFITVHVALIVTGLILVIVAG